MIYRARFWLLHRRARKHPTDLVWALLAEHDAETVRMLLIDGVGMRRIMGLEERAGVDSPAT
jgi:hypothetical protein